jgi:hypothetical protein
VKRFERSVPKFPRIFYNNLVGKLIQLNKFRYTSKVEIYHSLPLILTSCKVNSSNRLLEKPEIFEIIKLCSNFVLSLQRTQRD